MNSVPGRIRYRNCFTFIEVVVASLLLTIAMVPILRALSASYIMSRTIEYKTQSLVHAKAKLDKIKAESIYYFDNDFSEQSSVIEGDYLVTVDDDDLSPADDDLREINVFVGFDQNHNQQLEDEEVEVTFSTMIARRWY
jgi:hypothetical protein